MQNLERFEYERLLSRFYGFSDSLLRWLRIRYEHDGTRNVEVELACRDAQAPENEGWVIVRMLIRNVQEYTIREQANTTLQVLSEGIHLQEFDDAVGLEFGGALESLEIKDDMRKSDGFVIGREIAIEVRPFKIDN